MSAAAAVPEPAPEPMVLAQQLHHQLQHDLAHSPIGPAPAPAGYLDASRTLLAHLQRSLDSQEGTHDYREVRDWGQDRRHCAVTSRLLDAAASALSPSTPTRAAWETAHRFLTAAQATVADLLGETPAPPNLRLHLIRGGRG